MRYKKSYRKKRSYRRRKTAYNPAPRVLRPYCQTRQKTSGRFPIAGCFQFAPDTTAANSCQYASFALTQFELKMVISFNSFYRDLTVFWVGSGAVGTPDPWPNTNTNYIISRSANLAYNMFEDPSTSFNVPNNAGDVQSSLTQYNPFINNMDRYQTHWCYKMKIRWCPTISFGQEFNTTMGSTTTQLVRGVKYSMKCAFVPNGNFTFHDPSDALPAINTNQALNPAMYSRSYKPDLYWWDLGRPFKVLFKNPIVQPATLNDQRIWQNSYDVSTVNHDNIGYLDIIFRVFIQPRENQDNLQSRITLSPGEFQITKYFICGASGMYKYYSLRPTSVKVTKVIPDVEMV